MASPYDHFIADFGGDNIWKIYKTFPNFGNDDLPRSDAPDTQRIEHAVIFAAEILRVEIHKQAERLIQAIEGRR